MDRVTVILTLSLVSLGTGIIMGLAPFLFLYRNRRASRAPPEEEQPESSQQTMGSDPPGREQVS